MSGIFPNSGSGPSESANSLPTPGVVDGCSPLWNSTARCQPRFDPASANAVISELVNLMNCNGMDYDCNALDNLCQALAMHSLYGNYDTGLSTLHTVIAASTVYINQTLTIANSSVFSIPVLVMLNVRSIFALTDGEGATVTARLHDGPTIADLELTQALLDYSLNAAAWGCLIRPVRHVTLIVPPGGRVVTISVAGEKSSGAANGGDVTVGAELSWYGARGNTFN